jgi:hypothetical protein
MIIALITGSNQTVNIWIMTERKWKQEAERKKKTLGP